MTLRVAIASEFDPYDGEIYRFLLEAILQQPVEKWIGDFSFTGCSSVVKLAPAFLATAAAHGIRHALLAVDNDGGGLKRLEHAEDCAPVPFAVDDKTTCRECWLSQALPASWGPNGERSCVVVPVQCIETWLLSIRGDDLAPAPEKKYDRAALKKLFFGKPTPPVAGRVELALAELRKPTALETLAERTSFQRFRARISDWP